MSIKGFSQKYSVALFWATIALLILVIVLVFMNFSRSGRYMRGGYGSQGSSYQPSAQGQNYPQRSGSGAPSGSQGTGQTTQ
jgi:hypothetical protein